MMTNLINFGHFYKLKFFNTTHMKITSNKACTFSKKKLPRSISNIESHNFFEAHRSS